MATLGSRLARLNQKLTPAEREELAGLAGTSLETIAGGLVDAVSPERLSPAVQAGPEAVRNLVATALRPLAASPELRERIIELRRAHDITIDEVNADTLLSAAGVPLAERARRTVRDWREYLERHRDEISVLPPVA